MTSVVSTVAGGLETPDFLELRKNAGRAQSEVSDSGPRSLYQVVPEKQAAVRGLMGSDRTYDVSAVAGPNAAIPVLGDDRGTKVCLLCLLCLGVRGLIDICDSHSAKQTVLISQLMLPNSKVYQKRSYGEDTNTILVDLLVSLVLATEKTSRI